MTKQPVDYENVRFFRRKAKECEKEEARLPTLMEHIFAGATAGIVSKTVTAPLDRVKLFAQVEKYDQPTFRILYELQGMIKREGIFSWWKGNAVSVMKVGPESATKFVVYDLVKRHLQHPSVGDKKKAVKPPLTLGERFIAGAVAGLSSQTLVYPVDIVKTRMILTRKEVEFGQAVKILVTGYQKHGYRFFVAGYITSVTGSILYTGFDLSIYESLKRKYLEMKLVTAQCGMPPSYLVLAWGMCSSSIAQILTFPFSSMTASLQASDDYSHSSWETFKGILKKKSALGLTGLYRGLVPSLLKGVPAIGITYVVYEYSLHFMGTAMNT